MMWQVLVIASIIVSMNALCSWNRAIQPETADDNAATMNFVNGEWERDYLESSDGLLNGQPYWKKTQYSNCYVQTLYLYYYQGQDDGDLEWLVSTSLGNTPSSAYIRCSQDKPQKPNPLHCNGDWIFAPNGVPSSNSGNYVPDQDFYFKSGECPQLLCESVEFFTDANDFYAGVYDRVSTNDQNNRNVYLQTDNSDSSTKEFYLYFNENMFLWIINEEYETDCQKATDGQLTSVSTVLKWSSSSAISGKDFFYYEPGSTASRFIRCSGM